MPTTSDRKGLEPKASRLPAPKPGDRRTGVSFLFLHSHRQQSGVSEDSGFSPVCSTGVFRVIGGKQNKTKYHSTAFLLTFLVYKWEAEL